MKKVLIVEDDHLISELERDYLVSYGYEVDIENDGIKGLEAAQNNQYDIIILDVMLPGIDGFSICRRLRQEQNVPIMFVTAKQEDIDKIRGLGLGANDYIVKPFNPGEFVARVKAHTDMYERIIQEKQSQNETAEKIEVGDLVILVPYRKVILRGKEIELRNKEFELLLFLASNPGIVYSKETLFERIWGWDAEGDTSTVMVHINRLRDKIELDNSKPEYIQTVWGAGYRFSKK